jgi:hypothetical protein
VKRKTSAGSRPPRRPKRSHWCPREFTEVAPLFLLGATLATRAVLEPLFFPQGRRSNAALSGGFAPAGPLRSTRCSMTFRGWPCDRSLARGATPGAGPRAHPRCRDSRCVCASRRRVRAAGPGGSGGGAARGGGAWGGARAQRPPPRGVQSPPPRAAVGAGASRQWPWPLSLIPAAVPAAPRFVGGHLEQPSAETREGRRRRLVPGPLLGSSSLSAAADSGLPRGGGRAPWARCRERAGGRAPAGPGRGRVPSE